MNLYFEMMKKPVFSVQDITEYYNNIESARTALKSLIKKGLAVRIRNDLYTCISGETGGPIANRYQIASAINEDAYVSHHSAMEYYGVGNQVYYEVYVSSAKSFRDFEFDGLTYRHVPSRCDLGIEEVKYSGGVRITNRERTVIDSIKDFEKIAGLEEVLENIDGMQLLDEGKLLQYLDAYDNQFLYQKVGVLLYPRRTQLNLSEEFFEICKEKIGQSKRYLLKEETGYYNSTWQIVLPEEMRME